MYSKFAGLTLTLKRYGIMLIGVWFAMAPVSAQRPRLDYMSRASSDEIFRLAAMDKRPVMIFVHSSHCYSSRQFVREVMNKEEIMHLFRTHFNCMNADVSYRHGRRYANSNNLLVMPVLNLYSHDADLNYRVHLKLDKQYILEQVKYFITACNIKSQIQLLYKTTVNGNLSLASRRIGASYARIDFRKLSRTSFSKEVNLRRFTLGIRYFKDFETGYLEEWDKLMKKAEEIRPQ